MSLTIVELLRRAVRRNRQEPAVVDGLDGRTLTFGQLESRSNQVANALVELSDAPGGRIAMLMSNRVEWFEVELGIIKAGKVKVPIHPRLSRQEREYILAQSGAEGIILDGPIEDFHESRTRLPHLQHAIAISEARSDRASRTFGYEELLAHASTNHPEIVVPLDAPMNILYTSGTTGRPKGAVATSGARLAATMNMWLDEIDVISDDGMLHVAPLSHGSGSKILAYLLRGARNVVLPKFDPEQMLWSAARFNATASFLVPTMLAMLVETARSRAATPLRMVTYGGAPVSADVLRSALEVFGPVFVQIYGASEAPHPVTVLRREDHVASTDFDKRVRSAGRAVTNVSLRIIDEQGIDTCNGAPGEIWVSGPNLMSGYWNDQAATEQVLQNGWYKTGDIAWRDDDDFIYIVDRARDVVISGGLNVYPAEVELVLQGHPGVAEVAVIGVPDPHWGEAVKALVVPQPGTSPTSAELIDYCRENLAGYKKPQSVEFVGSLPKGATGKIDKRVVRARYWEGLGRQVH